MRVAGLAPVQGVQGLENIDVTKFVNGHMAYRAAMPKLLREVGWEMESDEFTEIEDPDPENHEKRQRELIHELDEARKATAAKPEKRRFGFFKKGKLAEKKGWETYDDSMRKGDDWTPGTAENGGNVLFDVEAIKRELESEQIEVRQLESTLPPMKLDMEDQPSRSPYSTLKQSQSYDAVKKPVLERGGRSSEPNGLNSVGNSSPSPMGHRENPFDQGYDEYNISAEAVNYQESVAHSKHSFESSLQSPSPRRSTNLPMYSPGLQSPSPRLSTHSSFNSPRPQSQTRDTAENDLPPSRPSLSTSPAIPSSASTPALEHNAWADEDDPEFGIEQEVKLTF